MWDEYVKMPLENCKGSDEARLGTRWYMVEELAYIRAVSGPVLGLEGIELQAGERTAIAPAIGSFGGSVVVCALTMRARFVGMRAMRAGCRG